MRIGPIHLIRDATFRKLRQLEHLWDRFSAALSAASRAGNPLADRVYEHANGLLHSPLCARVAPAHLDAPRPDPAADLAAAERVAAAFHRAKADYTEPPALSMWDRIGREKKEFLAALDRHDAPAVAAALGRMLASELTWGLGQVHPSHAELLKGEPPTHLHLRFIDTLVSLAEVVRAARVTDMLQDPATHLRALDRDPDELFAASAARLGFDPSLPAVGGAFGFRVGGKLVTIDSLTHAYNAFRLRQLGAGPAEVVFEIGGGYGCLALMAHRAGLRRYTVYDLPWVSALQGYFLIRSLPAGAVRLYGEGDGEVRVLPYWKLNDEPAGACGLLVNTDSLPEMGYPTARGYLPEIRRVTARMFLSVNQEAKAVVPGVGPQQCVSELMDEDGGFEVLSRQRYWMRQGYVEEVYRPI
jgi:putative sugar O-methyltransferase